MNGAVVVALCAVAKLGWGVKGGYLYGPYRGTMRSGAANAYGVKGVGLGPDD